jgi:hypothetical protein
MCKKGGEILGHLFHCTVMKDLWNMVFKMFGGEQLMPKHVVDLLVCWKGMVNWNAVVNFL